MGIFYNKNIRKWLVVASGFVCLNSFALNGPWRGKLDIGQVKLELVFNFTENADGKTECTLDVPAQGAKGISTMVDYCGADSVAVSVNAIGAALKGKINGNEISGVFMQHGYSFPIVLNPEKSLAERRPQTPCPPFPYSQTDTVFTSFDGTVLSGTLMIPANVDKDKIPAVVMVTGSGPQNRDEELFEHNPFAVIADKLARNGIASFRYDDRGTFKSKGNFAASTFETFKNDAECALRFVESFPRIGKTGILGHSEGGTIALMLASENKPDFIISLAGMAVSGKDCIMRQNERTLDRLGIDEIEKEESLQLISACFDHIIEGNDERSFNVDEYIRENDLGVPHEVVASVKANLKAGNEWFGSFLRVNPREWLSKISIPVLALNGEIDTQVESSSNLRLINEFVNTAETKSYPGLNHLFQHATTGEMNEYGEITETISAEVLDDVAAFIEKLQSGSIP